MLPSFFLEAPMQTIEERARRIFDKLAQTKELDTNTVWHYFYGGRLDLIKLILLVSTYGKET